MRRTDHRGGPGLVADVARALRFARGLGPFLRAAPVGGDAVASRAARRTDAFLDLLDRAVFAHAGSPYARLMRHAGLDRDDVAGLVRSRGLEGALAVLHEAGVRVSLDEFKGRTPIRRPGLEIDARPEDFDGPLRTGRYAARSGGSRGRGTRLLVDLEILAQEAEHLALLYAAWDVEDRPLGMWLPVPPGSAGLKNALRHARLGRPVCRWFSQTAPRPSDRRAVLFTALALRVAALAGRPLPTPEHAPPERPDRVAHWLADKAACDSPAVLVTYASSAVRACQAARRLGLDISGTVFRVTGEPYTPSKDRVVRQAGALAMCSYSMAEVGLLGLSCAAREVVDEVHLLSDRLAVVPRERPGGGHGPERALHLTTLLPDSPRILINVESGDHGLLERRACGCPLEAAGLPEHLHTVRSHEKLTGEGVAFLGRALIETLERTLPAACGGGPTDYQLVETEDDGIPRVDLVVGPRVRESSSRRLAEVLLAALGDGGSPGRMMADQWRRARTLRVVRREPAVTPAGKVLPLHRAR